MKLMKFQRPALTNWPGVGRIADLRDEIDRLFEPSVVGFAPALDVHEDKDNFIVKIELPGIKKEDVNVSLQDGSLTISVNARTKPRRRTPRSITPSGSSDASNAPCRCRQPSRRTR